MVRGLLPKAVAGWTAGTTAQHRSHCSARQVSARRIAGRPRCYSAALMARQEDLKEVGDR